MLGALSAVVTTVAACAAGLFIVRRWAFGCSFAGQLALGLSATFSALIVAAYLCALVGALDATPLVTSAAAFALRTPSPGRPPFSLESAIVGGLTILGAWLWFIVPVAQRVVPWGWDPTFHTLIIDLYVREGAVPTNWAPYDAVSPFRYPSGLHAVLGGYGRWTGWSAPALFTWSMVLVAGAVLVTSYALGERLAGGTYGGAMAVALFGLSDGWGTLTNHSLWGGLPSMCGLLFQGAFFLACAGPAGVDSVAPEPRAATTGPGWRRLWNWLRLDGAPSATVRAAWLGALFLVASAFEHHLSLVMTAGCALTLILAELISERRLSAVGQSVLRACVVAGALSVLAVGLRSTGRFDWREALRFSTALHDFGRSVDALRPPLFLFGTVGLAACFVLLTGPRERTLLTWAVGLVAFWVVWDVPYRLLMFYWEGANIAAFTPTRALTNLAWPLAVAAAVALARIGSTRPQQRAVLAGIVFAVIASGYRNQLERIHANIAHNENTRKIAALCAEVNRTVPDDAALFTAERTEPWLWLAPLCRRETNHFALPVYTWPGWYSERLAIPNPTAWAQYVRQHGTKKPYQISARRLDDAGPAVAEGGGLWLYALP